MFEESVPIWYRKPPAICVVVFFWDRYRVDENEKSSPAHAFIARDNTQLYLRGARVGFARIRGRKQKQE